MTVTLDTAPMPVLSYEQALLEVRACVSASRTSFGAGMAILPRERREGMYALYAFCRLVDDIADDGPTETARREGLNLWRAKIKNLFQNRQVDDAVTTALLPAIDRYHLIEDDFQAIIDGMEMDAGDPIVAPDAATLDLYCDRVASAVGRASVRIFGDAREEGMHVAFHLGRAFQLTNILRDLAEDAERGRLYLPRELLQAYGITQSNPKRIIRDPHISNVCRDLAKQARTHFALADKAMLSCPKAAMRPARIMRAYYGAIFEKLVMSDWRDPFHRVSLSKGKKIWVLLRGFIKSYF